MKRRGRLIDAALSYERAARGKPSAQILERAARCLLEGEDLRSRGAGARGVAGVGAFRSRESRWRGSMSGPACAKAP
jgi:hypothetical protein